MTKLISFIIPSRRLNNVKEFFDNIEATVSDTSCVEVLIKFDDDHQEVPAFMDAEISKRPFTIKYICTPRLEGVFSVWVGVEQLFFMSDPTSYFVMIMSDEPRFKTMHWDKVLAKYKSFYADNVFRLRLSQMKFCNYTTHYECTFRPDSFPIYTRKWLELTEGTGQCWGSDAYQQCIAFQLSLGPGSYLNVFREGALCRDITVNDIELGGLDFGVGVSAAEQKIRHRRNLREWSRLSSFVMQEHFSYLACRINAYVWAKQHGIEDFILVKKPFRKVVAVTKNDKVLTEIYYGVPHSIVLCQNLFRSTLTHIRHSLGWALRTLKDIVKRPVENETQTVAEVVQLTPKKRIRDITLTIYTHFLVPYNLVTKLFDYLVTQDPPGISVLRRNPNIPKGIKPPAKEQLDWLKNELQEQERIRKNLQVKIF